MIAVEEVEVAFRFVACADVVLILEPFRKLRLRFCGSSLLELDEPVIQAPACSGNSRIVDEHEQTVFVHPVHACDDIVAFESRFLYQKVHIEYFRTNLIRGLRDVVSAHRRAVRGVAARFEKSASARREEIFLHPFLRFVSSKQILLFL